MGIFSSSQEAIPSTKPQVIIWKLESRDRTNDKYLEDEEYVSSFNNSPKKRAELKGRKMSDEKELRESYFKKLGIINDGTVTHASERSMSFQPTS